MSPLECSKTKFQENRLSVMAEDISEMSIDRLLSLLEAYESRGGPDNITEQVSQAQIIFELKTRGYEFEYDDGDLIAFDPDGNKVAESGGN